jgi:hypothetical protein
VWIASSKRFIAIWRNTAATAPSRRAGQEVEPLGGAGRALQQPLEHDVLAEDRRRLGEGQRGGEVEDALRRASVACTPWPSSWAIVSTSCGREV